MEQFWMGSGSSLQAYSDLKQVYLGSTTVAPLAFSQSFADTFKTTKERIGLMLLDRSGSTGILYAHGSLVNNHEWWHTYEVGNVTSYAAIRDAVNILIEDDTIERIVLNVESPGGSVAGINAASDVIKSAKRKKPIQAHTDNMATSAGYWLASATDLVTAGKMASVGSIGVIAIYEEFTKAAEKYGIQFHVFTAGKEKGYGFGGTEFTDEEKEAIQSRIDKMYNFFLSHVASARNVSLRDKETWADAKIFFAGEAKAVGLVDSITSLEDVIGGKAAVSKNSNKKSAKAMTISEEKLARIAAGESPETVLTPAELAMHLEGQIEGEGDNEPEAPEAPENPTEPEVEPEVPEAPSATATADLTKMAISLGRAEAKVESLEAQLTALREELEASKAGVSALTVVAQAAVTNLQIALREPKEKATAPAAILAQYEELQGKFQSKFSAGRKSSAKADTAEMDMTPRIPNPNRPL
jgi:capsid assembly protease